MASRAPTPTDPSDASEAASELPPIRRPVLFYTTVTVAFSLLGGAVLALLL